LCGLSAQQVFNLGGIFSRMRRAAPPVLTGPDFIVGTRGAGQIITAAIQWVNTPCKRVTPI
jgi:hypothetical protein